MVRQLYLYSIEAADFPDSVTSENTLREFPLVIAIVAKVSRKRGLWLVVRVKMQVVTNNRVRHENVPSHILFFTTTVIPRNPPAKTGGRSDDSPHP